MAQTMRRSPARTATTQEEFNLGKKPHSSKPWEAGSLAGLLPKSEMSTLSKTSLIL